MFDPKKTADKLLARMLQSQSNWRKQHLFWPITKLYFSQVTCTERSRQRFARFRKKCRGTACIYGVMSSDYSNRAWKWLKLGQKLQRCWRWLIWASGKVQNGLKINVAFFKNFLNILCKMLARQKIGLQLYTVFSYFSPKQVYTALM